MDFLNQAYSQAGDLLRSMTPAARLTTSLLLIAVVVSFVFLFRTQTDKADHFLFGAQQLSEKELASIQVALGKANLNDWERKQQMIVVPTTRKALYYKALADHNVFPELAGMAAEEANGSQSPLDSKDLRDKKTRLAKETDLASNIRQWSGVENAFVVIDEVESGKFRRFKKLHASVAVQMEANLEVDEQLATSIRRFVAFGAGMDMKDVAVVDERTHRSFGDDSDGNPMLSGQNLYTEAKRHHEQDLKRKIEGLLQHIRGVRVSVFAQLNGNLMTKTETRKFDSQPVPINSTETEVKSSTTTPKPAGRVGVAANATGGGNAALAVGSQLTTEKTASESITKNENVAGSSRQVTEVAGLVPERFFVTVLVPRSYLAQTWMAANPPAEGEEQQAPTPDDIDSIAPTEKQKINQAVARILPEQPPGLDVYPDVHVGEFIDVPSEPRPGPSIAETAGSWFAGNWQTIGMFGLAIFGVIMLRGMLQSGNEGQSAAGQSIPINTLAIHAPSAESIDGEEEDEGNPNSLKARFQTSGRSLRDELTELVREDPDAAANVLKNWIGDVA